MNTRSRFLFILFVIAVAFLLIWPNIGQRTVEVHLLPGLAAEQSEAALAGIEEFLHSNYHGRYTGSRQQSSGPNPETYYEIKGNFIQAAFLNELSRLKNVDSEKVLIQPMWVEEKLKARPFKLGLDLQGGMNLVLEADFDRLHQQLAERYPQSYQDDLQKRIAAETDSVKKQNLEFELKQIRESMDFSEEKKQSYVAGALEIIRSRIDKTGVSEPLIRLQGNDKIEISLPGVASPQQAKKIIASTARVEYHMVEEKGDYTRKANEHFEDFRSLQSEAARSQRIREIESLIALPGEYQIFTQWSKDPQSVKETLKPDHFLVLEKTVALSGDDISPNTYVGFDSDRLQHTVNFQLTAEGTKKFADLTSQNRGRQLAIVIDDKIRSAPSINDPILTGSAQIHGSFSQQEARDLALIIKEGALPVPMKIAEERSVGPSLGKESIENGVMAVAIGFVLVLIYMLVYYHTAGAIAGLGLLVNLLFMAGIMALMNFTITLPGLAGVVLTIGMAVDANVIIYERMREELALGKSLKAATSLAFERASLTILDGNLTTMLAAIVLSQFGVGPIKGFAVTLLIGIITTLFTALFVTKTIFFGLVYDFNLHRLSLGWGKYRKASAGQ